LHHFTNEEVESIQILANQVAFSVQQARLFQSAQKEHKAIQATQDVTRLIGTVDNPRPMWEAILAGARAVTGANRGRIFVLGCNAAPLYARSVHQF